MLHLLHLLVFDARTGWRIEACGSRGWRPAVLVPRQLCVFESVPCRQVRLHEMSGFARVQARRLSPFRRTGSSAVRRAGRLHLWMWDADEVDSLIRNRVTAKVRLVAESVYLPWPSGEGTNKLRCTQTEDGLVCRDGAVLEANVGSPMPLQLSALTRNPAGFDWIGGALDAAGSVASALDGALLFNRFGLLCALSALGYLGYEGGRLWGGVDAAQTLEARLANHVAARGQRAGLESAARADAKWLESYLTASAQLDVPGLLAALRPTMEAFGVVIREFDAAGPQLRVVFVSAGGEIRLPDFLQALRGLAGVSGVRLDQHKELGEATFVMEAPGFVRQAAIHAPSERQHEQQ